MVVLFAVTLIIILAMVAFGVDVGYMMVRRTEAQRAVDAAVLAAADVLDDEEAKESDVVETAKTFLTANGISNAELSEQHLQVEFGHWNRDAYSFEQTKFDDANAVRVALSVNDSMFFGRVLGRTDFFFGNEAIAIGNGGSPPRDVMLVIDCSGSMDDDGGRPPQPISAVKDAAHILCDSARTEDHIGLTVYGWRDPALFDRETGHLEILMTADREAVKGLISTLTAGHYANYTNIAGGIRVGGESLRDASRSNVERVLIVLTDGLANRVEPPYGVPDRDLPYGNPPEQPGGDARKSALGWAQEIAAEGITIHTVSLGEEADHGLMATVAQIGSGNHYPITGSVAAYTQELRDVFKELGQGDGSRSVLVK
jgi:Mg-chelatase subunit ChlD